MASRRGKAVEDKAGNLKLRVEIIDESGNRQKIVDDLEVGDLRNEREARQMLDAIQETLEEDFDCEFE